MSDDGQRVVVVELVVKLVHVGVRLPGLRGTGPLLGRLVFLTGVVGVTALRTETGRVRESDVYTVQIVKRNLW